MSTRALTAKPAGSGPGGGSSGRSGFLRVSTRPSDGAGSAGGSGARPRPAGLGAAARAVLDPAKARRAASEIRSWPEYAPTPLRDLGSLARSLGISRVWLKDESGRLGLGSFKAVGGAYAVLRTLQDAVEAKTGRRPSAAELRVRPARDLVPGLTVTTATAGNHGRSVAWGAERFGCDCVIFLPAGAPQARASAIEGHGVRLERVDGDYDEAVRRADDEAARQGWLVISDTSYPGYEEIPRRVMEGYTLLAEELLEQLRDRGEPPPTHVFVQTGVGGLAAALCGALWAALGADRPRFVAVEPWTADCISRSLRAGTRRTAPGPFATEMTCLACGEPSTLAWRLLSGCLDRAIAIPDGPVADAVRWLGRGDPGAKVELGSSGAAGVGALLALVALPGARRLLGLDERSRVLALGTEGRLEAGVARSASA